VTGKLQDRVSTSLLIVIGLSLFVLRPGFIYMRELFKCAVNSLGAQRDCRNVIIPTCQCPFYLRVRKMI
jgi:hypothetical protein